MKNRSLTAVVGVVALGLFSSGCFFSDDSYEDADFESVREGLDEAAEGLGEAAEGLADALGDMASELSEGGVVDEPINFRELRDLLPEDIGDFTRHSREGKTEGALGFDVSAVSGDYRNEDGASFEVSIVDAGALPMVALSGIVDWMDIDIDEESDRGWKRTTDFDGYPAIEEFRRTDGDRGRAEYVYFVENRFVVSIEGRDVTMDEVLDVRDEIGTDDLEDMKDREGESRDDRRGSGRNR